MTARRHRRDPLYGWDAVLTPYLLRIRRAGWTTLESCQDGYLAIHVQGRAHGDEFVDALAREGFLATSQPYGGDTPYVDIYTGERQANRDEFDPEWWERLTSYLEARKR